MGSRWTRGAALGLMLLAVPLGGCETKQIKVQLDGFGDGAIEGVWLWRYSEAHDRYERICRIDFTNLEQTQDGEELEYAQNCVDGQEEQGPLLTATLQRVDGRPEAVVVDLWYMRYEEPGTYKATAFNASGESPLSPRSRAL